MQHSTTKFKSKFNNIKYSQKIHNVVATTKLSLDILHIL